MAAKACGRRVLPGRVPQGIPNRPGTVGVLLFSDKKPKTPRSRGRNDRHRSWLVGRVELESRPSDTQAWKFSLGPWVLSKQASLGFALVWRRARVRGPAGPSLLAAALARRGSPCWDPGLPGSTSVPMAIALATGCCGGGSAVRSSPVPIWGCVQRETGDSSPERQFPGETSPWLTSPVSPAALGGEGPLEEGQQKQEREMQKGRWAGMLTWGPCVLLRPLPNGGQPRPGALKDFPKAVELLNTQRGCDQVAGQQWMAERRPGDAYEASTARQ